MEKSILAYLDQVNSYGDKTAFRWVADDNKTVCSISCTDFVQDVYRAANCFIGMTGTGRKHIGIIAKNSYHFVVNFMAIIISNNVAVPLNYNNSVEMACELAAFADIDLILCDRENKERMTDSGYELVDIDFYQSGRNCVWDRDITCADDCAVLIFTSGTTGKNKCVMSSQTNMMAFLNFDLDLAKELKATVEKMESTIIANPMYHVAALIGVLIHSYTGLAVNICEDMRYMMRDLKLMPSEVTSTVPMMVESWAKLVRSGKKDRLCGVSVIGSSGSSLGKETIEFLENNGIYLQTNYGMTETFGTGLYNNFHESRRYDSIGKVGGDVEVKIIDNEICFRTAANMLGYYKDKDETDKIIVDGWLHTGDLGYIDDGYVYLTGRKKNLIILSNGENVSPEELENWLRKCEDIKEIIVYEKDKKICAEVYCDESCRGAVEDFVSTYNKTIPMYKRIGLIEFRNEPFERTSTGKIKR